MSAKTSAYLIIIRPVNFFITFFTGFIAVIICLNDNFSIRIAVLVGLSAAFTAAAGNVINDIYDIEIDKINRPGRPLPLGLISVASAKLFYTLLVLISLAISYFINLEALIIVVASTILLLCYSKYLKKIPIL